MSILIFQYFLKKPTLLCVEIAQRSVELFIDQEPGVILEKLKAVLRQYVEPVRKGRSYEIKK